MLIFLVEYLQLLVCLLLTSNIKDGSGRLGVADCSACDGTQHLRSVVVGHDGEPAEHLAGISLLKDFGGQVLPSNAKPVKKQLKHDTCMNNSLGRGEDMYSGSGFRTGIKIYFIYLFIGKRILPIK